MSDRGELPLDTDPELLMQVASSPSARQGTELFTLAALCSIPLRHMRVMIVTPISIAIFLVTLGVGFARYTAESQFTPATSSPSLGGIAGVAAQLGVNVRNLTGQQSVDLYASLLQSRDLMSKSVTTVYRFPTERGGRDTIAASLLQLYDVNGKSHEDSVLRAIEKFKNRLTVDVDETANTVTIKVEADWPTLAEQIDRLLLDQVNRFNVEQLQSQASVERAFIEGRMSQAQSELDSAEVRLRRFLEANKTYQSSPRLLFEQQRLQARLDLRQQVYTTLAQSYEEARIAEVRGTPVITIIDAPEGSAVRHRHIVRNSILGLFVGIILGIALAFGMEHVQEEKLRNPDEYLEFARLRRAVWQRIAPRRLLGRVPRNR